MQIKICYQIRCFEYTLFKIWLGEDSTSTPLSKEMLGL